MAFAEVAARRGEKKETPRPHVDIQGGLSPDPRGEKPSGDIYRTTNNDAEFNGTTGAFISKLLQHQIRLSIEDGRLIGATPVGVEFPAELADEIHTRKGELTQWFYDRDPRPDLSEDHPAWFVLLTTARRRSRDVWGLLHGLRCGGASLSWRPNKKPRLKLDYGDNLKPHGVWTEMEIRREWMMPHRQALVEVFAAAEEAIDTQSVEVVLGRKNQRGDMNMRKGA